MKKEINLKIIVDVPEQEEHIPTIIGRTYIPRDNSYAINLSDTVGGLKNPMLAGTINTPGKQCTIITQPFYNTIRTYNGSQTIQAFVLVRYQGIIAMVLFNERGLL